MKKILTLLILLCLSLNCFSQDKISSVKSFIPEMFMKYPNVRDLAITANEDEIYFTAQSYLGELSCIMTAKNANGRWLAPAVASFSGKYADLEPFLVQSGLRIYFVSNRPLDSAKKETKDYDIWYADRKDLASDWSEPKNLGAPVNTKQDEFYPSVSRFNNLLFTRDGAGSKGKDDIFYCKWENDKYTSVTSMNDSINSDGYEFNAFISADENYILYTCYNRKDGLGNGDLYISRKNKNNEWTNAVNLKSINSTMMDCCPFVNEKSGTLYFTSKRSTVKKQFDSKQSALYILREMQKYENGQSRIYQANFNTLEK